MFDERDIDWLAQLLSQVASEEIMPRFRRLDAGQVRRKSSAADLVTEADESAERAIAAVLAARYPHALVLGEEACSAAPDLLDGLAAAELAFVIDPVDGTYNFASGLPLFGVMLAVVARGETVAGIIHDPVGGDWAIGVRGAGSWIRAADGARLRLAVAEPVPVSEMTGAVSWSSVKQPERAMLARNHSKCLAQFGYRCAAHEYRLLAAGHAHFAVYNKLMPWDHLAGALIHSEAGGHAARFDGSPYRPGQLTGGLLVAPDRASWDALRSALWES